MRLADAIGRWFGRVEVVLSGAEGALREGELALDTGDFMRARAAAHAILVRVPGSPLGLALLADACAAGGLDAELAMTLEDLAARAPSRADVWVRLGRARAATGAGEDEIRDANVRALAVAEPGSDARRDALLALADLDLGRGDGARADLWLERAAADKSPDVALRRAEACLTRGDGQGALAWLRTFESEPTDGRAALARGRAAEMVGDGSALTSLLRAYVLETRGAGAALASAVAHVDDAPMRAKIRAVVDARGEASRARFRAAFAQAEGRRDEAREALREALAGGDRSAARPLLDAAIDDRDEAALRLALAAMEGADRGAEEGALVRDARLLLRAIDAAADAPVARRLDDLAAIAHERLLPWADGARRALVARWVPGAGGARWSELLARFDEHARALHDLEGTARIAALSAERARPVRVAIVGEFNAGKSTFINALIGAEVAPTGVLPTTATLHHLRYAPDPIAKIRFRDGIAPRERIVPTPTLRTTLKGIAEGQVERVEILLPIASLTRVEILDTPGFNAPDARHTESARAAFDEADAAIWLLDAAQPLKGSERDVLDEARRLRVPVQILVNKADRLDAASLAEVMRSIDAGLAEAHVTSWSPPLAFSARKALAGKLGDDAALTASGWGAIEALLDAQIVGRSDELKERALRRRALQIVALLGKDAARGAEEEEREAAARERRRGARARAAAAVDRDADDLTKRLAASLASAGEAWRSDLAVVVTGRDPGAAARDASVLRYRVDRALARLARPLAHAMPVMAPEADIAPADLTVLARTIVRTFAATTTDPADLTPLARSAVASLLEHLASASTEASRGDARAGLVRELAAFAEALA